MTEVETMQSDEVLTCEVRVDASPETIFPYLIEPERMASWMGTAVEAEASPGGAFRYDVQGKYVASGEFVAIEPPDRVVFTWGWEDDVASVGPGESTVEIELVADGEETVVRLRHSGLPAEGFAPHEHGWTHYLGRLAVAAPGGDPGPDLGPPA